MNTIADLRKSIVSPNEISKEYKDKMYQHLPELPSVKDRAKYLLVRSKDKNVLDIGSSGNISAAIKQTSKKYLGLDKVAGEGVYQIDLDDTQAQYPEYPDLELIIASEIVEHLSNPGHFLDALKHYYPEKEIIFTVPNAGAYLVKDSAEIVNPEHVCWYSYETFKNLLERHKYNITKIRWYNGTDHTAEGLIMVATT